MKRQILREAIANILEARNDYYPNRRKVITQDQLQKILTAGKDYTYNYSFPVHGLPSYDKTKDEGAYKFLFTKKGKVKVVRNPGSTSKWLDDKEVTSKAFDVTDVAGILQKITDWDAIAYSHVGSTISMHQRFERERKELRAKYDKLFGHGTEVKDVFGELATGVSSWLPSKDRDLAKALKNAFSSAAGGKASVVNSSYWDDDTNYSETNFFNFVANGDDVDVYRLRDIDGVVQKAQLFGHYKKTDAAKMVRDVNKFWDNVFKNLY